MRWLMALILPMHCTMLLTGNAEVSPPSTTEKFARRAAARGWKPLVKVLV